MPGTSNYVIFSDELAEILKRNEEQMKRGGAVIMKTGGQAQQSKKRSKNG
jgi:hypothetical protein